MEWRGGGHQQNHEPESRNAHQKGRARQVLLPPISLDCWCVGRPPLLSRHGRKLPNSIDSRSSIHSPLERCPEGSFPMVFHSSKRVEILGWILQGCHRHKCWFHQSLTWLWQIVFHLSLERLLFQPYDRFFLQQFRIQGNRCADTGIGTKGYLCADTSE